jgi:hypothetical protein
VVVERGRWEQKRASVDVVGYTIYSIHEGGSCLVNYSIIPIPKLVQLCVE